MFSKRSSLYFVVIILIVCSFSWYLLVVNDFQSDLALGILATFILVFLGIDLQVSIGTYKPNSAEPDNTYQSENILSTDEVKNALSDVLDKENNDTQLNTSGRPIDWIRLSEEHSDDQQLEILEKAFQRFPGSRRLVEKLLEVMNDQVESENPFLKREGLLKIQDYLSLFYQNCSIDDYRELKEIEEQYLEEVETLGSDASEAIEEQAQQLLEDYQELADEFLNSGDIDENLLDELEEIENQFTDHILRSFPDIREQFEKTGEQVVEHLNELRENKEMQKRKKYNEQVFESAEKVFKRFKNTGMTKEHEKAELLEIAEEEMTKWDQSYFMPEVASYFNYVHEQIFDYLNDEQKKSLTRSKLQAEPLTPEDVSSA